MVWKPCQHVFHIQSHVCAVSRAVYGKMAIRQGQQRPKHDVLHSDGLWSWLLTLSSFASSFGRLVCHHRGVCRVWRRLSCFKTKIKASRTACFGLCVATGSQTNDTVTLRLCGVRALHLQQAMHRGRIVYNQSNPQRPQAHLPLELSSCPVPRRAGNQHPAGQQQQGRQQACQLQSLVGRIHQGTPAAPPRHRWLRREQ